MGEEQRRVDTVRRSASEIENNLIDAYADGRITRREFVRRGTVIGMSLPLLSFLAAACGGDDGAGTTAAAETGEVRRGGTLRTAIIGPSQTVDPLKVADEGGLAVLGQTGEYLTWSDEKLELQPRLAESWEPNDDGSVWTFRIRQGVTFHDGAALTAEDVATTLNTHADPDNGSPALSAFTGVLSKGAARAVDEATVEVRLEAPNGNFPYLVSSDNYNVIILPADHDYGSNYERSFNGTGPWKLDRFRQGNNVSYTKNPEYWDQERQPFADRSEIRFLDEEQARVLALQGGEVEVVSNFTATGGAGILTDPNVSVLEVKSVEHRQIHMRVDRPPFDDKNVRQALALTLDRQAIIEGLFEGKADLGNDHPFAPAFPSTDPDVPQREQDLDQARSLLAEAGSEDGLGAQLRTWDGVEIPDLAQLVQDFAQEVGIRIELNITDAGTYYGDAVFGKSPWLDSVLGITDYGHRGVPNVYLTAVYKSDGTWNAAHFKNPQADQLINEYMRALDIDSQRAAARQLQELLLDETPVIIPYFFTRLAATTGNVTGVEVTGMGHVDLTRAGFKA
ncbi:MAG TPA: ABC transporter substrate-binding protein [Gaiellaceae bacterium]|nr:ABC transporter substrate-binding protein [Gaiellaceae bacterium]